MSKVLDEPKVGPHTAKAASVCVGSSMYELTLALAENENSWKSNGLLFKRCIEMFRNFLKLSVSTFNCQDDNLFFFYHLSLQLH